MILVDTDVILDVALDRAPHADDCRPLTRFARVAPTDTEAFRFAASLPIPDLEDAMQVAAARACGALYIATRNGKDFADSPVPARTPKELLEELG